MAKTMGANEMTGWEKPQHYNFLERWAMKRKTTLNTLILIFIIGLATWNLKTWTSEYQYSQKKQSGCVLVGQAMKMGTSTLAPIPLKPVCKNSTR